MAKTALALGLILVGALCIWGAISQVIKGETTGGTGKGLVRRDTEPTYFWYMFMVRAILGPISLVLGMIALGK